jgi:predicted nucleic acid-binding protein
MLVDAGVWIASRSPSELHFEDANALLRDRRNSVAALDLTIYEVANTLAGKLREPRHAERFAEAILSRCFGERYVRIDDGILRQAVEVAAEHGITVYDAAYVATARSRGWQLVSTDVRDLVSRGLAVTPDAAV